MSREQCAHKYLDFADVLLRRKGMSVEVLLEQMKEEYQDCVARMTKKGMSLDDIEAKS